MKFLIQTINNENKHDFSFTLLRSIEFHEWLGNNIEYKLSDNINEFGYVPIGDNNFVSDYLTQYYNKTPKPWNIPSQLLDIRFTGRNVINGNNNDILGTKFVKSNDKIKDFTEICDSAPSGKYQISDIIEIESEWRAFIFKGKMVGLNNYSGSFDIFPDVSLIKEMINAFTDQPPAFTLDVAITNGNTVIIEVHDFFSCGLYGFADLKILPYMFSQWFYYFIRQ